MAKFSERLTSIEIEQAAQSVAIHHFSTRFDKIELMLEKNQENMSGLQKTVDARNIKINFLKKQLTFCITGLTALSALHFKNFFGRFFQ